MEQYTCVLFTLSILLYSTTGVTSTNYKQFDHKLTDYGVTITHGGGPYFPEDVQIELKGLHSTHLFNYSKTSVKFDVPVYIKHENNKHHKILDTDNTQEYMIYKDSTHDTLLSLHCHNKETHTKYPCLVQSVLGIIYLHGDQYFIQPENADQELRQKMPEENQKRHHILQHRIYKTAGYPKKLHHFRNNDVMKPNHSVMFAPRSKRGLLKPKDYMIEIMAIIDNDNKWSVSKTNQKRLQEMRTYYGHVFYGINKLFSNIKDNEARFSVKLMGIVLTLQVNQVYKVSLNGEKYLERKAALNALSKERKKYYSDFDHVILFTSHHISQGSSSTVGIANVGAMCSDQSVSIVYEAGGFMEILIGTHEIGHSLNAKHDGVGNSCPEANSNIMSAKVESSQSPSQKLNSFLFSQCSINTMKLFAQNIRNNCLENPAPPFKEAPPAISQPTGQVYSPLEQCRTINGYAAFCPEMFRQPPENICLNLNCLIGSNSCQAQYAAHKTSCGNRKWCVFGKCQYDKEAPQMDESCPYGDNKNLQITVRFLSRGVIIRPKNCSHLIQLIPKFCEEEKEKVQCCQTCNGKKVPFELPTSRSHLNNVPTSSFSMTHSQTDYERDKKKGTTPFSSASSLAKVWYSFICVTYVLSQSLL